MKRLVAAEELNAICSFCVELQKAQLAQSQVIIKRIVKAKQKYEKHHQPQGKTLNLREYTLSLNEESRAPRPVPWSVGTFVPEVDLQDQIEKAIKAPGPDLILAEAMKTAPKRQA